MPQRRRSTIASASADGADMTDVAFFRPGFGKVLNYGRRLLQPQYWPELRRFAVKRLSGRPTDENTAQRAQQQTRAMVLTPEATLAALGLPAAALRSFSVDHPARLTAAEVRVSVSPGGMGGGADVDLLYSLCLALNAVRVLETGVAFGWSSLAILTAIADRPGAKLASVDLPYLGANLDHLVGIAVPEDLRRAWSLHRGADRDELRGAIADTRPTDIAHYDSDKSYLGRLWAYPLIWESLRPGGLLISDDVEDNLAFLDFAEEVQETPLIVHTPSRDRLSGILRKTGP